MLSDDSTIGLRLPRSVGLGVGLVLSAISHRLLVGRLASWHAEARSEAPDPSREALLAERRHSVAERGEDDDGLDKRVQRCQTGRSDLRSGEDARKAEQHGTGHVGPQEVVQIDAVGIVQEPMRLRERRAHTGVDTASFVTAIQRRKTERPAESQRPSKADLDRRWRPSTTEQHWLQRRR